VTPSEEQVKVPRWHKPLEKFEGLVVAALSMLMVVLVTVMLAVVAYIFVTRVGRFTTSVDDFAELQKASLHSFAGILLVLLGLELLETVKIYFREHSVRVEVILLLGLIAMGRHVLEMDLYSINPLVLFGFSSLVLSLAISYFFVKRAKSTGR
jgi:uncharacterized membrane protein (DUF373 family)